MSLKFGLLILLVFSMACSSQKLRNEQNNLPVKNDFTPVFSKEPGIMVYKTKSDYWDKVPVLLSEDKTQIIAYPHPKDLRIGGKLVLPDKLADGYLLDNRGIQENTGFLNYTYEAYSLLSKPPSFEEMNKNILDRNPFTELCNCGDKSGFVDIQQQLNQLIKENVLRKKCKVIR